MEIAKFVSVKQAVKETGLSEFFIRRSIRAGIIPVIKCGNKYMINKDKFQELLESMEKET